MRASGQCGSFCWVLAAGRSGLDDALPPSSCRGRKRLDGGARLAFMAELKNRLQNDLTEAIRARDELTSSTLRMALTALKAEEVSGSSARELGDGEIVTVLAREAKKRREAATAFQDAGRADRAQRETAELGVLLRYLPEQLDDAKLAAIIDAAVAEVAASGATGMAAMGRVMKIVQPQTAGKAEGAKVAAAVRARLTAS